MNLVIFGAFFKLEPVGEKLYDQEETLPQKNNFHLMSSEMWLGAESYPVSIWCITVSAPCNPQRGHCNWELG
jgi:hypothetical protein